MPVRDSLSADQARRMQLRAQGFGMPKPSAVGTRAIRNTLDRLGAVQVDSVNVLSRAHYLPVFSRIGAYPREQLDRLAAQRPLRLFEYWGHEASLLPVRLQPYLRWRMAEDHAWSGVAATAAENPARVAQVLRVLADAGPLTGSQLEERLESGTGRRKDHWGWNWSITKHIVEHLFWTGEVTTAGRDTGFRRRYDIAERVLPPQVLRQPTPTRREAVRHLVAQAAAALGVCTAADARDYYRLPAADTRTALADLQEQGVLLPVTVPGWPQAWLHRDATLPRAVDARALVVPFDPLIWQRDRVMRVFGFRYRIEIYTPAAQREFGYYVLPFLLGDRLVARVDLKADRSAGALLVRSAWAEADQVHDAVAGPLADTLWELAGWLGQSDIRVAPAGTLAAALEAAVGA